MCCKQQAFQWSSGWKMLLKLKHPTLLDSFGRRIIYYQAGSINAKLGSVMQLDNFSWTPAISEPSSDY